MSFTYQWTSGPSSGEVRENNEVFSEEVRYSETKAENWIATGSRPMVEDV